MQPSPITLTSNPKWSYREGSSKTHIILDKNAPNVIQSMLQEVIGMTYKQHGWYEASKIIAEIEAKLRDHYFEIKYGTVPF